MAFYLVLGCPRSGTSLMAGLLHKNHVHMGDTFNELKADMNPSGFYEDLAFTDWNHRILAQAGGDDIDWPSNARIYQAAADIGFHHHIVNRINERMLAWTDWGVKDPRIVVLWMHYWPCIRTDMQPRLIFTHRNPASIARSWVKWGRFRSVVEGLRVVARYEERMAFIAHSVPWPTIHLSFEDWWQFPDRTRARLNEFTGYELNYEHFQENLWRS